MPAKRRRGMAATYSHTPHGNSSSATDHPGVVVTVLRSIGASLLVTIALVAMVILSDFNKRQLPLLPARNDARIGIVFTGQFDRIDTALQLFDQGKIDRLMISGVGPGSGLFPETLADQFDFSPRARAALLTGDIVLSPDPVDTFDNAAEVACWLRANNIPTDAAVILITSVSHMPRASITLQRALPPSTPIYRFSPPMTDIDRAAQQPELGKFVFSWLATLMPGPHRPEDHLSLCTGANAP